MYRKSVVLFTGLALLVLGSGLMTAQDKKARTAQREADKQAIDKLTREMIQAFVPWDFVCENNPVNADISPRTLLLVDNLQLRRLSRHGASDGVPAR